MKKLSSVTISGGLTVDQATTLSGVVSVGGIGTGAYTSVLVRNSSNQMLYRNFSDFVNDISGSLNLSGYVPTSRTLTINGTTYDLSADRTWTINTVAYTSRLQHQVKAGVAINKGQAVYVTSADGTNMIVGLASNASEATSSKTMGLLDATVSTNGFANVVTEGLLAGLDTSTAGTEGDPVWLGTGGNLIYGLANKPYAPAHLVFIGIVTRKNANNGEIFVKVQNGFELREIHDVDLITTVPVNGHILGFDGTLWVNKTIAGWLGYTPANASGTTNYISKFTGSTTLGNSQIFDNGTNVGIGLTTPQKKLDVSGTGIVASFGGTFSPGQFAGLHFGYSESNSNNDSYKKSALVFERTDNHAQGGNASGKIHFLLNNIASGSATSLSHSVMVIDTDAVGTLGSARVGIGTTSPAYTLDVNGSFNAVTSGVSLTYNSGVLYHGPTYYQFPSGSYYYLYGRTGMGLIFGSNNAEVGRFDLSGNLGIGTTSPSQKLDVAGGDIILSSNATYIRSKDASGNTPRMFGINPSNDTYIGPIDSYAGGAVFYGVSANVASQTFYTGATARLHIASGGNVGIGTTSPSEKLHIYGAGDRLIKIENTGTYLMYVGLLSNEGYIGSTNATALGFYTNNVNRIYINTSGNIGIGTTSPSATLSIQTGVSDSSGNAFLFTGYGSKEYVSISKLGFIRTRASDLNGANMHFIDNGGALRMEMAVNTTSMTWYSHALSSTFMVFQHTTGNIGIGTTSPGGKLDVVGDNNVFIVSSKTADTTLPTKTIATFNGIYNNGGNGHNLYINSTAELGPWEFNMTKTWGGFLTFGVSGDGTARTRALYINNNNYVGVGVNPTSGDKFEVAGSVRIHTGNNWDGIQIYAGGQDGYIRGIGDEVGLHIRSEYGNVLLADDRGSVGIGTTTPVYKLDVNGNARFVNEIYVGGVWSTTYGPRNSGDHINFVDWSSNVKARLTTNSGVLAVSDRKLSLGILDLNTSGTPGQFKIKTSIPWNYGGSDFTVNIKGFRYGLSQMVSLSIGWHFYNNEFYSRNAICNGAWAPTISLAKSPDGYVIIHLPSPNYWAKLYVESVYSSNSADSYTSGWSWSDADLSDCTLIQTVPYRDLATNISGNAATATFATTAGALSSMNISQFTNNSGYITSYTETDTLASVTNRGNSTTNRINVRGIGNQSGGNIMMGDVGEGTSKWSYLTGTHYNATSQPQGFALIGGLSTSGGNAVVIGGNIYETNPATEIQFWTHSDTTHNLGGTQRGVINLVGNWGVGTTSPQSRLHVETSSSNIFRMVRGSTNFGFEIGGGAIGLYDYEDSVYRWYVDSIGNVGIGTTSPSTALDVNGNILSNSTLYAGSTNNTRISIDSGTIYSYYSNEANARVAISRDIFYGGQAGIGFGGGGTFAMIGDGGATNGSSLAFSLSAGIGNGPSNEKMRLTSTGLGIGTASPSEKLYVNSGGAYMDTTVSYGTNTKGIVINQEDGTGYGTGVWFRQAGLTAGIGSTRVSSGNWATDLRFYTHPASTTNQNTLYEAMRINSEGKVSIGTTDTNSDKSDFTVYTGGTTTLALAGNLLRVGDTDVNWGVALRSNGVLETYGQNLYLGSAAGNYPVTINPNGTNSVSFYQTESYLNTYTRINYNWGGGAYGTEAFTIRGTYPSIALRSTTHDSKWLIHHASELQFYYGASADTNAWANAFSIPTDGDIYMSWAGSNISTLLNAKQNASTAITTSNIGSQSVSYATSSGSSGYASYTPRVAIEDTRSGQRTPNDYDDYRASWEFTNQIPGLSGSSWWSLMTLQGWHNAYAAWQIIGPSDAGPENWYLRVGNNTTWGTARRIWHDGDFTSTNISNWNTTYGWGNHASAGYLTSVTAHTQAWSTITSTPTTISGYGITNAYTDAQIQNFFNGANSISGYNKSNWDTAYSWGNHASASYATTSYVTTQINNLVNGAPGALDTLSELASALGNDASFATTVTNSIASKLSLSGGTMSGALNLANNDIQGVGSIYISDPGAGEGINWNGGNGWGIFECPDVFDNTAGNLQFALNATTRLMTLNTAGALWIAGALTEASSLKLKENIETSEGNLEKVVNLRPVTYNKIGSQTTELGLIAEEVAEVYPEFVQYDENGEPVGVHYSRLTAALIGAVKQLTQRIETLEKNG